jgi:predicted acetyltransferase
MRQKPFFPQALPRMPSSGRTPGETEASDAPSHGAAAPLSPASASRTDWSRNGDANCLRDLGADVRILTANAGDHPLILQLLIQARQQQLSEDFQSRLDQPNYRPADRLLLRRGKTLLGHVHVASHIGWFESQRVPLVKLEDLAILPEYRGSDLDSELLWAAESIAADEGAVLAVVHTERPDWFERHGWSVLRGQGHTRASARAVLAHLDAQDQFRRRRRTAAQVRTWRHFELDKIRDLYDQVAAAWWGPLYRSEIFWQWLIGRKAQDQVLLAVAPRRNGLPPALAANDHAFDNAAEQSVGYAIVCGGAIVEMITISGNTSARVQLLARACRDAMDRDHQAISLYTQAADPLHELLVTAGGAWIDDGAAGGPRWMIKLLSPERWVERCYELWRRRARAADVPRPFELGVQTDRQRYRYTLTRRSSRMEASEELPKHRVQCDQTTLDSLLIGNLDIAKAIHQGALRLSNPELAPQIAALFPPRLFWQSSLELMRV